MTFTARMPEPPELPPSTITVKDGRVVEAKQWVLWNLEPFPTIIVRREPDGTFFSSIGDPEHGGGSANGTLREVLQGLHPTVRQRYEALFGLTLRPGTADLHRLGFDNYRIIYDAPLAVECGFCKASFPTTEALYAHQRKEHDPDGIMFSEIGLPK